MTHKSLRMVMFVLTGVLFLCIYSVFAETVTLESGKAIESVENADLKKNSDNLYNEKIQVIQFFEKLNSVIGKMNSGVTQRVPLIAQAKATGNEQEIRRLAGEIRDLIVQQKQAFETLTQFTPTACQESKLVYLEFMQLRQESYDELSKGNNEKARLLSLEAAKFYNKSLEDSGRIRQHYGLK